ncbi:hypothetical protein L7F22_020054 [Adiantum nelumboides]|nr:hypothetical protein [Adiantum nelumboides]
MYSDSDTEEVDNNYAAVTRTKKEAEAVARSKNGMPNWLLQDDQEIEEWNLGSKSDPKMIKINKLLKEELKDKAWNLFLKFKDVFAWEHSDLKGIDPEVCQHTIPLKPDARPVRLQRYRMNPNYAKKVQEEIDNLLKAGFITEVASSDWLFPVVVVPKKNGKLRVSRREPIQPFSASLAISVAVDAVHDALTPCSSEEVNLDLSPQTRVCSLPLHSIDAMDANLAMSVSSENKPGVSARSPNEALRLGPHANAAGSPLDRHCQTLRASASSLPTGKGRFHSVQKSAGIGKHTNGRGVGRANKLAQLEVAAEHIGTSHHVLLTSPRLLRSPGRKNSPIRWFPRKKTESYLDRKIRMLQEKEGKVVSLDETLGAANLHLSRIEREKLAAQAAAAEAMNLRKGALVEASWCRILKLAGIPCKQAILEMQKAEKKAATALAEAENRGVILHQGPAEREAGFGAVTASLDTAFDVDKEVTAAIKVALRHVSSSGDRECDAAYNNSGDMTTELAQSQSSDPETKDECIHGEQVIQDDPVSRRTSLCLRPGSVDKQDPLIAMMVSRIEELGLEHQTALAGIVATCGLSELLKNQSLEQELSERPAELSNPMSNEGSDLGSILVKHVSRLQREVQAAKDTSRLSQAEGQKGSGGRQKVAHVESLDQILVKHVSKLEKEKLAAAQARRKMTSETPELENSPTEVCTQNGFCKEVKEDGRSALERDRKTLCEVTNISCDSNLKQVPTREKEKQLASTMPADLHAANVNKVHSESAKTLDGAGSTVQLDCDPGSILVKHVSRLEKEKQMAKALAQDPGKKGDKSKQSCQVGLGDILVKRLSRLEIEKAKALRTGEKEFQSDENSYPASLHSDNENDETGRAANSGSDAGPWRLSNAQKSLQLQGTWGGPAMLREPPLIRSNATRRKSLREKQLEEAWGGVSLGNALKRHVSKLEKEQAAWRCAEDKARQSLALQR